MDSGEDEGIVRLLQDVDRGAKVPSIEASRGHSRCLEHTVCPISPEDDAAGSVLILEYVPLTYQNLAGKRRNTRYAPLREIIREFVKVIGSDGLAFIRKPEDECGEDMSSSKESGREDPRGDLRGDIDWAIGRYKSGTLMYRVPAMDPATIWIEFTSFGKEDPGVGKLAIHFRIDNGPEQREMIVKVYRLMAALGDYRV